MSNSLSSLMSRMTSSSGEILHHEDKSPRKRAEFFRQPRKAVARERLEIVERGRFCCRSSPWLFLVMLASKRMTEVKP